MPQKYVPIYDRILKILARHYPEGFIRLALPGIRLQLTGTVENVELAVPSQWVDFVHRFETAPGEEFIFHLEFQTRYEPDFPRRMFVYSALLTVQFDLPVVSMALFLTPRLAGIPEAYEVRVGEVMTNRFTYIPVRLWEYRDEIEAGKWPELAPLLVMLVDKPDEKVLERERELILREEDEKKRADLLACAITIGSRYFPRDFLLRYFREEVEMMREATIIDEWLEEKHREGFEKGIIKGREEGLKQGLQQGLRKAIIRLLISRFELPYLVGEAIEEKLEKITDLDALQDLVTVASRVSDLREFEDELDKTLLRSHKLA